MTSSQTGPSPWRRLAAWAWPGRPARWRDVPARLAPTLVTVGRLTLAAVVSYLISLPLTEGAIDLTGPLTALLVVQASAFSTIKMGAVRVGAVLSGVLVATVLSTVVGLTWWSLGAAIAASLLLSKVLRLGEQALETPISAMLILGVTNHDVAAEVRILNTLIGAAVGVAFNLLYPPAMPTASAGRALLRVAEGAAAPLDAAADALENGPVTRERVEDWVVRARAANRLVAEATERIAALRDSRRFNPRALGTADVEPILASGLDTLEHALLSIRALFAVVLTELPNATSVRDDPYGAELRTVFAVVLRDTAECLRSFGGLVVAEAEDREEETEQALGQSLDVLRETQAILTELIMVDAEANTSAWLLRGSILAAVEQVLSRLNLEDRARLHRRWMEEQARRRLGRLPPLIDVVLPHPDRPFPRGLVRPGRGASPNRRRRRGR
ncbi:FUSC family protein [Cellulomonas aerilata]|uniref:FUSC family protein n=1 Tax=Cellulomonas aerilata TaxID=515326 RepID=A0A512DBZ2_9CELL|nr:FUSC family protein [Cellulomonas aerilata]GEO33983.1 FUSC family protein [Cellulomonas aerilata]